MLKEFIYKGLGASVVLKEKIEEELKILEKKGKIKKCDSKKFLDSLEQKGKDKDKKIKKKIKSLVKEALNELGVATKEDIEKLKDELKKDLS